MDRRVSALVFAIVTSLAATAVACGGSDSPDPTPAVTPSASAPATDTVSPSPSADATDTPTPTEAAPTATPLPPTPAATATPNGNASPPGVYEHGDRDSNMVALTFDMGGRVDPALDIMQLLIDNEVPATIFMTGAIVETANTDAGREVLDIVCNRSDLFEPANHSYSHPDFRELSTAEMEEELATTESAMLELCPTTPRPIFRPPFGGIDARVAADLEALGYGYVIMWDVDTIDWRPESEGGPTAAAITSKVLANAGGGTIVLMHLGGYNTLDALPAMVQGLRDAGFELVTVRTMLGLPR
jgi:peptidoglycan/xylan/chitin deacetylase (PgdA/CDA1 family)